MNGAGLVFLWGVVMSIAANAIAGTGGGGEEWLYITSSAKQGRNSIDLYRLELSSGTLTATGVSTEWPGPNFLAMSKDQRFLYASCNPKQGAVAAFGIDAGTGKLSALNQQASAGERAVHVTLEPSGRAALVANYQGNTVAVLGIEADGSLKAVVDGGVATHSGSGPNKDRQAHPFPHSIYPDPTGKFAYSCDLGVDKIYCYRLDAAHATLTANNPPTVTTPPGSGPRHLAFSPDHQCMYVVTEMGNTVIGYHVDAMTGGLKEFQTVSTLPAGTAAAEQRGGEVEVHPSGKWLFVSNRGPLNSMTTFAVDAASGELRRASDVGASGDEPRSFVIDPSGDYVVVGNQFSNNVVVFRLDHSTGQLHPTGSAALPGPTSIIFWTKPHEMPGK
jgi:6-phosphogluconolactonase